MSAARPRARPVPGRRLPGAVPIARLIARTGPRSAHESIELRRGGTLEQVGAHKRALLITYRRSGRPVPTPVWAAELDGRLYVRSERAAGKMQRLRRDPRLLVAPCTVRGRPLGVPFEAVATVLSEEREPLAERALRTRYGLGRRLFEAVMDALRIDMGYLEIVPEAWDPLAATPRQ